MGNNEQKIEELKQRGYNPVYIWDAEPNEEDPDHTHSFDTHLLILEGEIEIRMDGKSMIMKSESEIDIPKEKVHYGKAGQNGCKYIVAELH
jgi:quercetin dioxygenase-like cupin family protein